MKLSHHQWLYDHYNQYEVEKIMKKYYSCNQYLHTISETEDPRDYKTKEEAVNAAIEDLFSWNREVEKIIKRNNDHIKALRKLIETSK